jgi:hypothetical protein
MDNLALLRLSAARKSHILRPKTWFLSPVAKVSGSETQLCNFACAGRQFGRFQNVSGRWIVIQREQIGPLPECMLFYHMFLFVA